MTVLVALIRVNDFVLYNIVATEIKQCIRVQLYHDVKLIIFFYNTNNSVKHCPYSYKIKISKYVFYMITN